MSRKLLNLPTPRNPNCFVPSPRSALRIGLEICMALEIHIHVDKFLKLITMIWAKEDSMTSFMRLVPEQNRYQKGLRA